MDRLQCYAGTKKEEIISFITKNTGKKIKLHYENNIYDCWGDDDEVEILIKDDGLNKALQIVDECYIHNVYVL